MNQELSLLVREGTQAKLVGNSPLPAMIFILQKQMQVKQTHYIGKIFVNM